MLCTQIKVIRHWATYTTGLRIPDEIALSKLVAILEKRHDGALFRTNAIVVDESVDALLLEMKEDALVFWDNQAHPVSAFFSDSCLI